MNKTVDVSNLKPEQIQHIESLIQLFKEQNIKENSYFLQSNLEQKIKGKFREFDNRKKRKVYAHLIEVDDINLPSREDLYDR